MSNRLRARRYRIRREAARGQGGSGSRGSALFPTARSIRWGSGLAWLGVVLVALVLQTAVVGRIQIVGVSPDLLTVAVAAAAFRLRDNGVLLLGFGGGLLLDVSGTSVIGLWAFAMTLVAWGAVLSRDYGGRGILANGLRILLLTLAGLVAHLVISIAFGEWSLAIWEALRRLIVIPVLNLGVATLLYPVLNRLWMPSLR